MDLDDICEEIRSREDLAAFVDELSSDLEQKPGEWENRDLASYLDALARCVQDMDGWYKNRGEAVPDQPTWKMLAEILLGAKVYE